MNFPNFDWTTRITLTLALALAAGCTPAMDANTSDVDGLVTAAHTEQGDRLVDTTATKPTDTTATKPTDTTATKPTDTTATKPTDTTATKPTDTTATKPTDAPVNSVRICDVDPAGTGQDIIDCIERVTATNGTVNLPAGEFVVSETIVLPTGVELVGAGAQTVLSLDAGVDAPVLAIGSLDQQPDTNKMVSSVTVRDLSIFGNREEQNMESMDDAAWIPVAGIVVRAAHDVSIIGVTISDTISSGVMVDAGSERVLLQMVEVYDSSFDGITVQDSAEVTIQKSSLLSNGGSGISFDWGVLDSLVSGSVISDNGYTWGGGDNPGVYMAMTSNTIIEASDISDNDGNGVVLTNQGMANDPSMTCSSENLFSRNEISNNGRFGFSITHSTCTDNRSEENVTRDNAWGPVFETTCGQLDIVGNICEGPGCKATCVN